MESQSIVFKTNLAEAQSHAAYDTVLRSWPVAFEELYIPTRFGETHLLVCGPKFSRPLLLLHGQEASATMWFPNIQSLSQEHRVYALDTLGDFGKSKPVRLPVNRMEYADWLVEVMDALHLAQTDVAGFSYGGFLAANLALNCPERIHYLILLAPGIPNLGSPTFKWALYGMPMLMFPSPYTIRRFLNGASMKGYVNSDLVQQQMIVSVPGMRQRFFLRPVFQDEELYQVRLPVLLMIGDHEILYDPRVVSKCARELFPQLQVEVVPQAGHLLISDQPELVNTLLLRFLDG